MLLENSSSARWAGLAIISVPSLFVVGLFWWNVRAQDAEYADRRAAVTAVTSKNGESGGVPLPTASPVAVGAAMNPPIEQAPAIVTPPQAAVSPAVVASSAEKPSIPAKTETEPTVLASVVPPVLPEPQVKSRSPESAPATPLPTILPAEFDRQDGMLLGCNELVLYHPRLMIDIIKALSGKRGFEIYGIVNDAEQRLKVESLLAEKGLPTGTVKFLEIAARGMWVRDYGPKFIRNQSGGLTIVDYSYLDLVATDGMFRPDDDKVPARIAELFRMDMLPVPLSMEGGNLLTNGYGLCLTTNHLATENQHRGYSVEKVGKIIGETYGQRQWSYIDPLPGDRTKHADTYVTFLSPNVVAVGSCDPLLDPAAAATMDRTAAQLASVSVDGQPLQVVRMPMLMQQDGVCRTYTNSILANGTALVPQYSDVDPKLNSQALAIYAKHLPNWKIVGIECLEIAEKGGALHCISCNIPSPSLVPVDPNDP